MVAYILALPDTARIHPVFHVSLLKKKVGDVSRITSDLPPFFETNTPLLQPQNVRDFQWMKQGAKYVTEALVQWKNMSPEDATWEEVTYLAQQFLTSTLRTRIMFQEGQLMGILFERVGLGLLILNIKNNPIKRIRIRDRRKSCLNFLIILLGYLSLSLFELLSMLALSLFDL
jgi:hypothetical protein